MPARRGLIFSVLIGLAGAALCALVAVLTRPPAPGPKQAEAPPRARLAVVSPGKDDFANGSRFDWPEFETKEQPAPPPTPSPPPQARLEPDEPGQIRFKANALARVRSAADERSLVILQLGDSHTAADFFTGELRRRLQDIYGDGGAGYITAGKPHAGVRSSALKISTTQGWTYKAMQKSDSGAEFWLSGFNAIASEASESMTFAADHPVNFNAIEIEALPQPHGGTIAISLDDTVVSEYDLDSAKPDPVVIRLVPEQAVDRVHKVAITTKRAGAVNLSSVAIYNRRFGVSYNAVGFPGATVGIVNKYDERMFAYELRRISPQIVVLAFGTNEGFNDNLDTAEYAKAYTRVIEKIRSALPMVVIVLVSPPDAGRLPAHCKSGASHSGCGSESSRADACAWREPPQLGRVREIQRDIARRNHLVYWNWASIMPQACGAHQWVTATPALMAKDHVHFTLEGYRRSADALLNVLLPIIEKLRATKDVVSNN